MAIGDRPVKLYESYVRKSKGKTYLTDDTGQVLMAISCITLK